MKSIENNKKKYLIEFARKFYNKDMTELDKREYATLSVIAEIWALKSTIIPNGFEKFSIFDFVGYCQEGDDICKLNSNSVFKAKSALSQYCYGLKWADIKKENEQNGKTIRKFLDNNSQMKNRYKNGNNVIIYGDRNVKGKTMLSSIIMREAIDLRMLDTSQEYTYDWCDLDILKNALIKESFEASDYRFCDWLVIDNIVEPSGTPQQLSYFRSFMDPFFAERIKNHLPTILVFRYNVYNRLALTEEMYGHSVTSILSNKKSCKICLEKNIN